MNGRGSWSGLTGVRVVELRSVFSPLVLTGVLYVPLLVLYVLSSASVFATEFDSRKALSVSALVYFTLAMGAFALGAKLGDESARRRPGSGRPRVGDEPLTPSRRRSLVVLLEATLAISVFAYLVWFARGIARAGGLGTFLEIWRTNPHRIKAEILTTVPGVTTLTQLAVATIPLAIAYRLAARGSAVRVLLVLVFALAAVRAVVFNERLAFVELLVPLVFLLAAPRKVTVPRIALYGLAFLAAAVTFFALTELRRTYTYTQDFSAARATTRFFGYYLTSVNNGMVVVDHYPARTPLYATGATAWRFPGVHDLRLEHLPVVGTVSLRYADAFGVEPERFWPAAFAAQGLDYEFNVLTTPGYLAADFGWAGLLGMLLLGILSGRIYSRTETSPFHRALYGVWLVGLLELMRIYYFADTRVFPAYLVFVAAFLVVRPRPAFARARTHARGPSRAPEEPAAG